MQKYKLIVKEEDYFTCRITRYAKLEVIKNIKEKLNKRQEIMFRQSCLGALLDLDYKKFQWAAQVVHHLLLRQIDQPNREELWCLVGGKKLRFSINEYSLITGLLCHGELGDASQIRGDRLREKYFDGKSSISKFDLEKKILDYEGDSNSDCVKLALAYMVESLLMAKAHEKMIDMFTLKLVDNLEAFNQYPWGLQSFNFTIGFLKRAFIERVEKQKKKSEKNPDHLESYHLGGFIFAFQAWAYECICNLNPTFAIKEKDVLPRIINWKVIESGRYTILESAVFKATNVSEN